MKEKNDLMTGGQLPAENNPGKAEVNINAPIDEFVAHADEVNNYNRFILSPLPMDPELIDEEQEPSQALFGSREFYNLFVCSLDEKIATGYNDHFLVTKDRTLKEGYTIQKIVERVRGFSDSVKAEIMSYPAIICNENPETRRAGKKQTAWLSKITRINIQENGAMIFYRPIWGISQQRLNNHQTELGISTRDYFDEMMHTHWAIKQIDLIQVLEDIGLRIQL